MFNTLIMDDDNETSVTGVYSLVMPSMPSDASISQIIPNVEYRDISIIRRSTRTSNCAFINVNDVCVSVSSKTRILSNLPRHYTLEAHTLISDISARQKQAPQLVMRNVYKAFLKYRASRNYDICDEILRSIDVDTINFSLLVSLLMASYPIRTSLPYRSTLYNKVYKKAIILYSVAEAEQILNNLK